MFRMCHVMLGMCHVMFGVCATMLVLSAATCAERRAASPQSGFMMSALFPTDRRTDGDAPVGRKTAEALAFSSAVVISTQSFWLIDITHVETVLRVFVPITSVIARRWRVPPSSAEDQTKELR